ncbi:hypothetical protein Pdw03_0102 [Penicillium digitatum]|uniref:Uncharacterized protein n=1 Tax=Penicillium digitatum TaxID=36651 RepID=A0A7T6XQ55_PENDI|nr:hypothetical protein PDIDSM_8217 [Penicillium digitatum]QQK45204.1 hypothetical protein Pdw03_0102 [Penicillium digitatum]
MFHNEIPHCLVVGQDTHSHRRSDKAQLLKNVMLQRLFIVYPSAVYRDEEITSHLFDAWKDIVRHELVVTEEFSYICEFVPLQASCQVPAVTTVECGESGRSCMQDFASGIGGACASGNFPA